MPDYDGFFSFNIHSNNKVKFVDKFLELIKEPYIPREITLWFTL